MPKRPPLPFISALCPTYNRPTDSPHLLADCLRAWIDQDYPPERCELLIANDTPGQVLSCNAPNVRIYNRPQRFATLGQKIGFLAEEARGALLMRWDDDDYSLPHRLRYSAAAIGDAIEWRPANYWYAHGRRPWEEIHHAGNTHIMAVWRPAVLDLMGGYPDTTGDEDQEFNRRLAGLGRPKPKPDPIPTADMFYVYRWGVSPRHLSGGGGRREELDRSYHRIGRQDIASGIFLIEPAAQPLRRP